MQGRNSELPCVYQTVDTPLSRQATFPALPDVHQPTNFPNHLRNLAEVPLSKLGWLHPYLLMII